MRPRPRKTAAKTTKDAPAPGDAPAAELEGSNLGQVRELLFGNQIRDIDHRFARMEERLAKEVASLKSDVKTRQDSMELFVRNELEALSEAIQEEQSERTQALKEVSKELTKTANALEKKLTKLDEKLKKTERTMSQHILDQVNGLREELQEKAAQLEATIEREAGILDDSKTDRAALGALLQEMALRLTDGFDLADLG